MVTFNQLAKGVRKVKRKDAKAPAFQGAPHRKGVIYKISVMPPRKPNSAKRTFAKVRLIFNNKRVFAKIPGIGESRLEGASNFFFIGHGPKDSPGINYHLVRGLCDFVHPEGFIRTQGRSKYGLKKLKLK
jgi:small subunit ribosomal protein S12